MLCWFGLLYIHLCDIVLLLLLCTRRVQEGTEGNACEQGTESLHVTPKAKEEYKKEQKATHVSKEQSHYMWHQKQKKSTRRNKRQRMWAKEQSVVVIFFLALWVVTLLVTQEDNTWCFMFHRCFIYCTTTRESNTIS